MNKKEANIDLLFRNGLKDYEVLPPQEVWDDIYPAIKRKKRPLVFFRIAAVAAVLFTISLLGYRWSREVANIPSPAITAFNVPVFSPLSSSSTTSEQYLPVKKYGRVNEYSVALNETVKTGNVPDIIKNASVSEETGTFYKALAVSSDQVLYIPGAKNLTISNNEIAEKTVLTPLKTSQEPFKEIKYIDLQSFIDKNNETAKTGNRWSIAAMASPTYFSRFNTGSDELSKELMSSEQPLISYSGGVGFSYKINKKFTIQSGLYYSSLGQKIDGINSYSGFQRYVITKGGSNFEVLTTNGTIYTSNPDIFLASSGTDKVRTAYTSDVFDPEKENLESVSNSLNQNFSYLELPVVLRYKIVDKTIGINLIGGLSYNFLVNNSVYTVVDGTRYEVGETKGLNSHALSSSLGMGMEYNLSGKLSLNLEPTFRYYLNPLNSTTGSYIHSYSFGIFSGVSYKF
jgi:hypothetical protein